MLYPNDLLDFLPPINDKVDVLVESQDATDIVNEMVATAIMFQKMYDLICTQFEMGRVSVTLEMLWKFVKNNFTYKADSDMYQNLYAPNVMLTKCADEGFTIDCKNYSLFMYGILAGLKKRGFNYNPMFKFVSFNSNNQPTHVYVISNGYVLDCCTHGFDYEENYTFKQDVNPLTFKDMALQRITGINGKIGINNGFHKKKSHAHVFNPKTIDGYLINKPNALSATAVDSIYYKYYNSALAAYGNYYIDIVPVSQSTAHNNALWMSNFVVATGLCASNKNYQFFVYIVPTGTYKNTDIANEYNILYPPTKVGAAYIGEGKGGKGGGGKGGGGGGGGKGKGKGKSKGGGKKGRGGGKSTNTNNLLPPPKVTVENDTDIVVDGLVADVLSIIGVKVIVEGQNTGYTDTKSLNTSGVRFMNLQPDQYKVYCEEDLGILGKEKSDDVIVTIKGVGEHPIINTPPFTTVIPVQGGQPMGTTNFLTPKNIIIGGTILIFGKLIYDNKK